MARTNDSLPTLAFSEDADIDSLATVLTKLAGFSFAVEYVTGPGTHTDDILVWGVDPDQGSLVGALVEDETAEVDIPLGNIVALVYH